MTNKDRIITMSRDELESLIEAACEKAVQRAFHDLGLRSDEPKMVEEAREDFRFIRRWRTTFDSAAAKIGGAVIVTVMAGVLGLLWAGFQIAITAKTGVTPR